MGSKHRGTAAESRALDTYIKLRRAVNAINRREGEQMRNAGLTESQFGVLEALLHLGPLCQRELAVKVLKSAGNMTTVVDNLQRRGLVERTRDAEDRRVVTVELTDRGEALIRDAFPRVATALVEAFSVLTADEQKQLAALCRRLGVAES
jgi:MarR family 2-MHQ and catechol resistance regulon transcriptional repressor